MPRSSPSDIPVVSAVRVSPTLAVPVMVGVPVAGVFGPRTTNRGPPESIPPSPVQMAPWAGAVIGGVQVYGHVGAGAGGDVDPPSGGSCPGSSRRT